MAARSRPARRLGPVPIAFAPLLIALLSACGAADSEPGPGDVTVGEARALSEAAEMIEARQPAAEAPANDEDIESETGTATAREEERE